MSKRACLFSSYNTVGIWLTIATYSISVFCGKISTPPLRKTKSVSNPPLNILFLIKSLVSSSLRTARSVENFLGISMLRNDIAAQSLSICRPKNRILLALVRKCSYTQSPYTKARFISLIFSDEDDWYLPLKSICETCSAITSD